MITQYRLIASKISRPLQIVLLSRGFQESGVAGHGILNILIDKAQSLTEN
jgi:hypothetical protein